MIRKGRRRHSARLFTKVTTVAAVLLASVAMAPAANADSGLVTHDLSTLTPASLVNSLVGAGVTVSNVAYTGAQNAAGTFSAADNGTIGFGQGVVLSTGSVSNVVGPNTYDDVSTANGQPGDADLNALLPSGSTQDAAALSFDFVADASSISFRYVFASDEYNEYANSGFDDVFGFFVNGSDLAHDCATVDGAPVSVNTINGGNPFGTNPQHPELYRNNSIDDPGPATIDTEMDGLTTVLLCQAPVVANQTNTMKLAIADTGDQAYDSNVFIEAGSLTTAPPIGTPTNVVGNPSNGSAIVTWTPPAPNSNAPIDSFDVTCTATGNSDDSVTVNVPGTVSAAQVNGLTNGTEYTCEVRARSGDTIGDYSDPSAPFTPSDMAVAQFVTTGTGGTLNLTPGADSLGTSGQLVIPRQSTKSSLAAVNSGATVIVTAVLFGTPGETSSTCGGNPCVGQGITWSVSNPGAIGKMNVVFIESPALVNHRKVKTAAVYKDDVLLPKCSSTIKIMCVSDRDATAGGGWRITIKVDGSDPHGRA